MPIICPHPIRDLSQFEFDERDAVVMRCAYDSQNFLGRLCEERVYENDLALRLKAVGFRNVQTQVPVTLTHDTFSKTYFLDLVADDALYELKTVSALVGEHDAQILHYAMLRDVRHGKLLNFRNARVEGRLRFNALSTAQRRAVSFDESRWQPLCDACEPLKQRTQHLTNDLGAYLEGGLYEEALISHCGGEEACVSRVPVAREGLRLGSHRVTRHDPNIAFLVTTFAGDTSNQGVHIERLLRLTPLRGLQWINFNQATLEFVAMKTN
jgi:GxxExxY protein